MSKFKKIKNSKREWTQYYIDAVCSSPKERWKEMIKNILKNIGIILLSFVIFFYFYFITRVKINMAKEFWNKHSFSYWIR